MRLGSVLCGSIVSFQVGVRIGKGGGTQEQKDGKEEGNSQTRHETCSSKTSPPHRSAAPISSSPLFLLQGFDQVCHARSCSHLRTTLAELELEWVALPKDGLDGPLPLALGGNGLAAAYSMA